MNFGEFMTEKFSISELLDWATMYRNLYSDFGDEVFAQKADTLLKEAQRLTNEET